MKDKLICFIFCVLSFFSLKAETQKNSPLDQAILEKFFKDLLSSSSAGYVLYGEKPIYLANFRDEIYEIPGTKRHEWTIETSESMQIWKKLKPENNLSNYYFHFKEAIDDLQGNEFLWINKQALQNVLNENQLLFQSKWGPRVSFKTLLDKLLSLNGNILSLFKGDQALLGIVLGYGTHNSLTYERGMYLVQQLIEDAVINPPYKSKPSITNESEMVEKLSASKLMPSLDYSTIQEEIDDLTNLMKPPTNNLYNTSTKITFTHNKDTKESQSLLDMYLASQKLVEEALLSPVLVKNILEKFNIKLEFLDSELSNTNSIHFLNDFKENVSTISNLIAISIFVLIKDLELTAYSHEINHFEAFVNGMKKAQLKDTLSNEANEHTPFHVMRIQMSNNPQLKKNLEEIDQFFNKLALQESVQEILNHKLYVRMVKEGEGSSVSNHTHKVSLHYTVKDIDNNVLYTTNRFDEAPLIDLSKVIVGFRHGILGMKPNEIREISIHPDLAYGRHSKYGSGKVISFQLQLNQIYDDKKQLHLPELIPFDLSTTSKSIPLINFLNNEEKKFIEDCGYSLWMHFLKLENLLNLAHINSENILNLTDILKKVDKLRNNSLLYVPLTVKERQFLRRMHWIIYNYPS